MSIQYVFIKRSEVTLIAPVWLRYIVFVQMFFHGSLVLVWTATLSTLNWLFHCYNDKIGDLLLAFLKSESDFNRIVFWTGSINNPNNPPPLTPLKNPPTMPHYSKGKWHTRPVKDKVRAYNANRQSWWQLWGQEGGLLFNTNTTPRIWSVPLLQTKFPSKDGRKKNLSGKNL